VSRSRVFIALTVTALAAVTAGVLADRFVLTAEWWQTDQHTTTAPATPLLDLGPPAGPLTSGWHVDTRYWHSGLPSYDQIAHVVLGGRLVTISGWGLDGRDASTGAGRWYYHRAGWSLLGWTSSGTRIAAYLERTGHRSDRMLAGFDAVTGRIIWRRPGVAPQATDTATLRWPGGAGIALTGGPGGSDMLYGRSMATGGLIWTAALPSGCTIPDSAYLSDTDPATTTGLTALALDCDSTTRVLFLDLRTGHDPWSVDTGPADRPMVAVRGDVVAVESSDGVRLYSRSGRLLAARKGTEACGTAMCPLAVSGNRAVLVYRPDSGGPRMLAVDTRSGRTDWDRHSPGYPDLVAAGSGLYAVRDSVTTGQDSGPEPAGIDVLDPATGAPTTAPLAVVPQLGEPRSEPWLTAAGGLLYLAVPIGAQTDDTTGLPTSAGTRLFALRGAAVGDLDTAPATAWPDACTLLTPADLAKDSTYSSAPTSRPRTSQKSTPTTQRTADNTRPRTPTTAGAQESPPAMKRPASTPSAGTTASGGRGSAPGGGTGGGRIVKRPGYAVVSGMALPHPATCSYGSDGAGPTVTVAWVAGDADGAHRLLAALQDCRAVRPIDAGDEGFALDAQAVTVTARVGRYVISVSGQVTGQATRLVRAITGRLRPH